jgi:hypothetical protein
MSWTLDQGSHKRPEDGVCLMEAVAWVAGEQHTDVPECACPVLGAYGRQLNDRMPHEQRQRLAVFVPRLVGSRSTKAVELERMYRLADAAVRVFAPVALDARGEHDWARRLRDLDPIVDKPTALTAKAAAYAAAAAADADADAAAAAAAAAADAADAAAPVWDAAIDLFDRLIPSPAVSLARSYEDFEAALA